MEARRAGCIWCDVEIETERNCPTNRFVNMPCRRGSCFPCTTLSALRNCRKAFHARNAEKEKWTPSKSPRTQRRLRTVCVCFILRGARDVLSPCPWEKLVCPGRILALREGSAVAYAPIGDLPLRGRSVWRELKHLYRAHLLTQKPEVYCVIGDPIRHSLSPLMHNTGFVARKRDGRLSPVSRSRPKDFLIAIPEFGVRGFSITIPHKAKYPQTRFRLRAARRGDRRGQHGRRSPQWLFVREQYGLCCVLRALESKLKLRGSRVLVLERAARRGLLRSRLHAQGRRFPFVRVANRRQESWRARSVAKRFASRASHGNF